MSHVYFTQFEWPQRPNLRSINESNSVIDFGLIERYSFYYSILSVGERIMTIMMMK